MSAPAIEELSARGIDERIGELVALLADAVAGGASVGFVAPLAAGELEAFWRETALDVEDGMRCVLAAVDGGRIVGCVQLAPSPKANQRHRAEVQKLLVLTPARGRGIGAELMRAAEQRAAEMGRWLLTLDTREASDADRLYRRWGWTAVGTIPEYAADPDLRLAGCVFYYKRLTT
jgi:GNAT superfamily N-acetyltransferase